MSRQALTLVAQRVADRLATDLSARKREIQVMSSLLSYRADRSGRLLLKPASERAGSLADLAVEHPGGDGFLVSRARPADPERPGQRAEGTP